MPDAEPVSKPMHVVAIKQEASAIISVRHPYVRLELPLLLAALLQYCLMRLAAWGGCKGFDSQNMFRINLTTYAISA